MTRGLWTEVSRPVSVAFSHGFLGDWISGDDPRHIGGDIQSGDSLEGYSSLPYLFWFQYLMQNEAMVSTDNILLYLSSSQP